MGLREVTQQADLAGKLYRYAKEHHDQYPGVLDTHEILDVLATDHGWRLSLGIGNQGESFIDITILKTAFRHWEKTAL